MATGKGANFKLGNPTTLTDISLYIRSLTASNETEEVDGTVLTSTKREFESTFERDRATIRMKWSPAASTFVRGIKNAVNINYEYGPEGSASGKTKITGTCNVLRAQSFPASDPNSLTELELELNINSETYGTFV